MSALSALPQRACITSCVFGMFGSAWTQSYGQEAWTLPWCDPPGRFDLGCSRLRRPVCPTVVVELQTSLQCAAVCVICDPAQVHMRPNHLCMLAANFGQGNLPPHCGAILTATEPGQTSQRDKFAASMRTTFVAKCAEHLKRAADTASIAQVDTAVVVTLLNESADCAWSVRVLNLLASVWAVL